ncbi:MAG: Rsd/AlgQ family anti-sigma factor, partial [Gammaproteobacteria bacterium]
MPNTEPSEAASRPRSKKLIEDMLQERQQMLVLLWELSKFDFKTVDETINDILEDFQEILVDYIASGHFGLYQRIAEGTERRSAVVETARATYPRIARSTELAVEFTERYENAEPELLEAKLANDLSLLGEAVTTRI